MDIFENSLEIFQSAKILPLEIPPCAPSTEEQISCTDKAAFYVDLEVDPTAAPAPVCYDYPVPAEGNWPWGEGVATGPPL